MAKVDSYLSMFRNLKAELTASANKLAKTRYNYKLSFLLLNTKAILFKMHKISLINGLIIKNNRLNNLRVKNHDVYFSSKVL
jgi:hypothetical protein